MFSLAGIPPMMGFYAKLSVLQAVLSTGQIWLAVLAVLFSLIGAFYYLRVVKLMYFDEPADKGVIVASADMRIVLSINGLAVLVLGLMPDSLMSACFAAIVKTLAS
jgi:NADH-quinone oxidoreductase subunit N